MRRTAFLFLLLLLSLPVGLSAAVWTPETLPMIHLQDAQRYVCDPDNVMSEEARDSTDRTLALLEKEKGVESVVVVVKRLQDGDCYNFAMNLGAKYGVGSKTQKTGLIVVLSTEDRCYQIITGKGLEGALPDAICRRIENRVMVPALKRGDWDEAIAGSVEAISKYLHGDKSLVKDETQEESKGQLGGLILAVMVVIVILFVHRENKRRMRCPQCHKAQLQVTHRQKIMTQQGRRIRVTRQCPKCGYTSISDEDDPDDPNHMNGRGMIPPFFFGGSGGGFSGGGGGSFGGGSFGGGGSGGRF